MSDALDLATTSQVIATLAAGGVTLTASQTTALPDLITAASREIQRYLGRVIPALDRDEIVRPSQGRPEYGEPAVANLAQYPINSVTRVSGGRKSALTISNTDTTTNQIARVALSVTGDPEVQLAYTGVTLTRVASGTTTTDTLAFASYTTVNALAAAVNALSGGWTAAVTDGMGLWPSTELIGAREPKPGFSPGASLDVFAIEVASYAIDRAAGVLSVGYQSSWQVGGWGFQQGPSWADEDAVDAIATTTQVRVQYNAGYSTIPTAIRQFCAELVKATIERLKTDTSLKSESAKDYSYEVASAWGAMPPHLIQALNKYKDFRL